MFRLHRNRRPIAPTLRQTRTQTPRLVAQTIQPMNITHDFANERKPLGVPRGTRSGVRHYGYYLTRGDRLIAALIPEPLFLPLESALCKPNYRFNSVRNGMGIVATSFALNSTSGAIHVDDHLPTPRNSLEPYSPNEIFWQIWFPAAVFQDLGQPYKDEDWVRVLADEQHECLCDPPRLPGFDPGDRTLTHEPFRKALILTGRQPW